MSSFYCIRFQLVLGGALADRVGTRIVIAGMVVIWSLVQFSTIFVSSFAFLLITRIILGAGEGPSYSLAMTAASKWLPKEKRGIRTINCIHWGSTWSRNISSHFNESYASIMDGVQLLSLLELLGLSGLRYGYGL